MTPTSKQAGDGQDDASAHSATQTALGQQVANYSEFLHELAKQRHTIIKTIGGNSSYFKGYTDGNGKVMIEELDTLIRDVLKHLKVVNGLVATDKEPV